jgi:hypothetical protein
MYKNMAAKSKMASKTYVFVFLLSKASFLPDFNILFFIRNVFLVSKFCGRYFFREIKMADWFKIASFLGKNRHFSERVLPPLTKFIFQSVKASLKCTNPKFTKKNCQQIKITWRIFSRWRLHFFVA